MHEGWCLSSLANGRGMVDEINSRCSVMHLSAFFLIWECFCWMWRCRIARIACFRLCRSSVPLFLCPPIAPSHITLFPRFSLLEEAVNVSRTTSSRSWIKSCREVTVEALLSCLFNAKDGSSPQESRRWRDDKGCSCLFFSWGRVEKWHNGSGAQVSSLGHWYPWN